MKSKSTHKPTRSSSSLLRQLCNLILNHQVPKLARDTGVEYKACTFTLYSHIVKKLRHRRDGGILRDDLIRLTGPAAPHYPVELRRVVAIAEVEGEVRQMVFLTNNVEWIHQTISDLYCCRWSIEVFFTELKQTLQLADFLGHNGYAVKCQV